MIGFPDLLLLSEPTKRFISSVEGLLGIVYPTSTVRHSEEVHRNPVLRELTLLLLSLHQQRNPHQTNSNTVIKNWLEFTDNDIPDNLETLSKLQQPHIQAEMHAYGISDYCIPQISPKRQYPPISQHALERRVSLFRFTGNQERIILLTANDILQILISVNASVQPATGFFSYLTHVTVHSASNPSPLSQHQKSVPSSSHGNPSQPSDFSAICYSTRGAKLFATRDYIQHLARTMNPDMMILLETRQDSSSGQQMALRINYPCFLFLEPTAYSGGIWIFSKEERFSTSATRTTKKEIRVNLAANPTTED